MRFHFISETSDGFGIAERLQRSGHETCLWTRSTHATHVGDGIVAKVGDLNDLIEGQDSDEVIFVFDGSGNGYLADYLRQEGYAVLGDSVFADKLEHDRAFGSSFMKDCGLQTPESFNFTSWDDAVAFVKKYKDRLVYKPAKRLGEESPAHVSYDQDDMLEMLHNVEEETGDKEPEFQLQQFVKGIALSTECWFDGHDFIETMWNHTLERKELMNDNLGPSGGCTGNVVWACGACPVCKQLRKIGPALARNGYVGMIDFNSIVSEDGVFGLEWTPRFGYDATPTLLCELLDGSIADLFTYVASSRMGLTVPRLKQDQFAGGLRISIPPWPSEKHDAAQNIPIQGLTQADLKRTYLYNVKQHERHEDEIVSAGAWGILLLFTGLGDTVGRALSNPTKLAEKVRIPNKQYRTDLKTQFQDDLEKLKEVLDAVHEPVGRNAAA